MRIDRRARRSSNGDDSSLIPEPTMMGLGRDGRTITSGAIGTQRPQVLSTARAILYDAHGSMWIEDGGPAPARS